PQVHRLLAGGRPRRGGGRPGAVRGGRGHDPVRRYRATAAAGAGGWMAGALGSCIDIGDYLESCEPTAQREVVVAWSRQGNGRLVSSGREPLRLNPALTGCHTTLRDRAPGPPQSSGGVAEAPEGIVGPQEHMPVGDGR